MKTMLTLAIVVILATAAAGPAAAHDLGHRAPAKPAAAHQPPPADPGVLRQGGDTIAEAVPIAIPYDGAGTTAGYTDDYDEVCPYSQSTSPDVVYLVNPGEDVLVDIDLAGSAYDTKVYVYDADLNLLACNDDFYPDYTSKLELVPMTGGADHYVVVDGYGGDAGEYEILVSLNEPCVVECDPAPWVFVEDEPPLVDDYADAYNGGCNSPEFGNPFVAINNAIHYGLCGTSGWYTSDGAATRDTDWYEVTVGSNPNLSVVAFVEQPTYIFELGPQDCGSVEVLQSVEVAPCTEGELMIAAAPGETVWLWVGPTTFDGPVNEYTYQIYFDIPVATESHSWTSVKGLFD